MDYTNPAPRHVDWTRLAMQEGAMEIEGKDAPWICREKAAVAELCPADRTERELLIMTAALREDIYKRLGCALENYPRRKYELDHLRSYLKKQTGGKNNG